MRKLTKTEIFTLPNFLSAFRLLLLPGILVCLGHGENAAAFALLLLSAASDVLDGTAARALGKESDFGKLLDPVADKVTIATLLIFFATRFPSLWFLFLLLLLKEGFQLFGGILVYRQCARVTGARWFGKLATFALYATLGLCILFPSLPAFAVNTAAGVCAACMFLALDGYAIGDYRALSGGKEGEDLAKE